MVSIVSENPEEQDNVALLKFEQPFAQEPVTLIPNRASVVVPVAVATSIRAARGGAPALLGIGTPVHIPGPATDQIGTGLGEGADQFARYVEKLREAGLDVLFVMDATGSMGWALDEVKLRVRDIIEWVRELVPIARFGIVAYRDHGDPEFLVKAQSLTYSTIKLERFLKGLHAAGGGSLGESVLAGISTGVTEAGWRATGKRLIILIGDAPPHREDVDPLLRLVARFHSGGGQVTTLDVSDDANPELLEARLGRPVNRNLYRATPSFDFSLIAEVGGGDAATLDGELHLTRRLVNLIFGDSFNDDLLLALNAIDLDASEPQ